MSLDAFERGSHFTNASEGSKQLSDEGVQGAYGPQGKGADAKDQKCLAVKGLDIAQIPPYALYYGTYEAAKEVNAVGSHLGLAGKIASHVLDLGATPFEAVGLGLNELIGLPIKALWPKENMYEGFKGRIVPKYVDANAPQVYLPGIHKDGKIDFEW